MSLLQNKILEWFLWDESGSWLVCLLACSAMTCRTILPLPHVMTLNLFKLRGKHTCLQICQLMLVCAANVKCLQFCLSQIERDISIQLPLNFQSLIIFLYWYAKMNVGHGLSSDSGCHIENTRPWKKPFLRANILSDIMYKKVIWLQNLNQYFCTYTMSKELTIVPGLELTYVFDVQRILVSCLVCWTVSEYGCWSAVSSSFALDHRS